MSLITEDYREQNAKLHVKRDDFGKRSSQWAPIAMQYCAELGTTDILDYGCGKGEMNLCLPFAVQNYDPCVPKYAASPKPADIVFCTDVLEHVEPECLGEVLEDLRRCVKKLGVLGIPNMPAKKFLEDGRNAHLIQEDMDWWLERIRPRFHVSKNEAHELENGKPYYVFEVRPLQ